MSPCHSAQTHAYNLYFIHILYVFFSYISHSKLKTQTLNYTYRLLHIRDIHPHLQHYSSSFGNVDAVNNRFTVELVVRMIWKDQRLLFKHLRRDRHLNIILPKEVCATELCCNMFLLSSYRCEYEC